MLNYRVDKLTFSDASVVNVGARGILVITGPNNSGKSQALRDIASLVRAENTTLHDEPLEHTTVVRRIEQDFALTDHKEAIEKLILKQVRAQASYHTLKDEEKNDYFNLWKTFIGGNITDKFRPYILSFSRSEERFTHSQGTSRVSRDIDTHNPLHIMDRDIEVERKVSSTIRETFGVDLIGDFDGPTASLRIGDRALFSGDERKQSPEIGKLMASLPVLAAQGDGIKSFVNLTLESTTISKPLILIDEPEAFLHPPQVRNLARTLATKTSADTQLIVATHDYEFLRGLLEGSADRVSIIRLRRKDEKNIVTTLSNSDVKSLLADNLMRTTDALSALFHEATILCEGASDVIALRRVVELRNQGAKRLDIMFLPCGTKAQIDKAASSLKKLGVPVVALADCDTMNDLGLLKRLCAAFRVNETEIALAQQGLAKAINTKYSPKTSASIVGELERIVASMKLSDEYANGAPPSRKTRGEITALAKEPNQWSDIKKRGRTAVLDLDEDARAQFDLILEKFAEGGLIINRWGELEGLWPEGPSGKAKWIERLMSYSDEQLLTQPEFSNLVQQADALLEAASKAAEVT